MRDSLATTLRFKTSLIAAFALIAGLVPMHATYAAPSPIWAPFDLPRLQQTTLRSATGAPYRIVVATPAGAAPPEGYPVIYVVDGNAWTGFVSDIIRVNIGLGVQSRVEPAVVVGIGYPTSSAFDLKRRKLDLTSAVPRDSTDPDIGSGATGGDLALMKFIETVVKPTVEARFRIDRSRQTLLGHSLGGLFTLRTMLNRPSSFQTYVALSPSIWWNHRAVLKEAQQTLLQPGRPKNLRIFLSAGALEEEMTPAYLAHAKISAIASGKNKADADKDVANSRALYFRVTMVTNARRMAALLSLQHVNNVYFEIQGEDRFSSVPAALGRAVPFVLADSLSRD